MAQSASKRHMVRIGMSQNLNDLLRDNWLSSITTILVPHHRLFGWFCVLHLPDGVLKFYIQLNRQALIPPPSRDKVLRFFLQADITNDDKLNREEYSKLLRTLFRRAFVRLTVHKAATLLGAPLLAEMIARLMVSNIEAVQQFAQYILPHRFHDKVIPILTSKSFHRSLWLVILVSTLGNLCVNFANFVLDLSLPDESQDKRFLKYKRREK